MRIGNQIRSCDRSNFVLRVQPMRDLTQTTRFRFWLGLIALVGVIVPRRLRADWRQEVRKPNCAIAKRSSLIGTGSAGNKARFDLAQCRCVPGRAAAQPRRWEDDMFQDLIRPAHSSRKHPGFTLVAVFRSRSESAATVRCSASSIVLHQAAPLLTAREACGGHGGLSKVSIVAFAGAERDDGSGRLHDQRFRVQLDRPGEAARPGRHPGHRQSVHAPRRAGRDGSLL